MNDMNLIVETSAQTSWLIYVATLRNLARTCNFCDCMHDSLIRDRIVFGIHNRQTKKRLLQECKLDLKKCIGIYGSKKCIGIYGRSYTDETNRRRWV